MEAVNSQIADAKGMVFRDVYLDRLKEFVPAGNNPSYPDLLLALRILQQCLERFGPILREEKERHAAIGVDLTTILGALELAQQYETGSYGQEEGEESADQESEEDDSDNEQAAPEDAEEEKEEQGAVEETDEDEDPDESEDYEEFVPDYAVRQKVQGPVSDSWFKGYGDNRCFDFSKLDHVGIPIYKPPQDGITYDANQK